MLHGELDLEALSDLWPFASESGQSARTACMLCIFILTARICWGEVIRVVRSLELVVIISNYVL